MPNNAVCADLVGLPNAERILTRAQLIPDPTRRSYLGEAKISPGPAYPRKPPRPCQECPLLLGGVPGNRSPRYPPTLAPVEAMRSSG